MVIEQEVAKEGTAVLGALFPASPAQSCARPPWPFLHRGHPGTPPPLPTAGPDPRQLPARGEDKSPQVDEGSNSSGRHDAALTDLLVGSPPSPQAAHCWMKEQRCCQRSFHIDSPRNGRMTSAQRTIPTATTSNWQLP